MHHHKVQHKQDRDIVSHFTSRETEEQLQSNPQLFPSQLHGFMLTAQQHNQNEQKRQLGLGTVPQSQPTI
jgi:hypothetical protein